MEKPAQLRAALVAANPGFATDPDKLKIWVDKGRLVSRRTRALGFEYRYTLRLLVEDFTRGPDAIMVPLVLWLREHQPDLFLRFAQEDDAVQFAADILDAGAWDIAVTFELTEAVRVTARPDGSGWDVEHLPEPSPDDPLLPGALIDVPLGELWLGGDVLLPRAP